uniref:Uncharacterized protein n=1 Tax=Anguilla anguilla TaxID=7936 RepID=A0A0E9S0S0_ANGAN
MFYSYWIFQPDKDNEKASIVWINSLCAETD